MTDKQIIIDGIDVSKCWHRQGITCIVSQHGFCDKHPNCYFKQLAKAKQYFKESERLKSELQAKELELIMAKADLCRGCQYKNDYKAKEQECERLKWYLKEIRDDELKTLDIELDEYETHCIDTEYTNIINLVEEALEERSPEDCRYKKDK